MPAAIAVSDAVATLSCAALDDACERAVDAWRADGVGPGDRILVIGENSVAAVVAVLAACRLRAWAVPVNARLSAREVDAIARHCRPRLVIATTRVSCDAAAHGERLGARSVAPLDALGATLAPGGDPGDPEPLSGEPREQVAALIYTTGTTGTPKGVMLTHDNLLFVAGRSAEVRHLSRADRVYAVLPLSHVFGLASVVLGTLYQGARLDLVARFDAAHVARAFAEDGITIFQGVPQMYARLVALGERAGLRAPRLRYLSSGGAPLDPALKRRVEGLLGLALHNGYGATETSPTVTTTPTDAPVDDTGVGPPIPDVEVRIRPVTGVAPGAQDIGEIQVRGRLVMKGYYRDPDATAAVMTRDGWYRTGDLGRLDGRGHLHVVGRLKELIIRSGFNVYPPEVEAVLTEHPDVALAGVVGRLVADGNEEVVAYVQPRPGRAIDADALRAFAEARLAPYKRPAEYRVMAELPAAPSGKLLKHRLREMG
jgi:acyl-CoA synthetase (AMP-forming)/AMP-acid ligase II